MILRGGRLWVKQQYLVNTLFMKKYKSLSIDQLTAEIKDTLKRGRGNTQSKENLLTSRGQFCRSAYYRTQKRNWLQYIKKKKQFNERNILTSHSIRRELTARPKPKLKADKPSEGLNNFCRPGWFCLNKIPKCELKNCQMKQVEEFPKRPPTPPLNITQEYIVQDFNVSQCMRQILLAYTYLKSLEYSDRKTTYIVKYYCKQNTKLIQLFLQPKTKHGGFRIADCDYVYDYSKLIHNFAAITSEMPRIQLKQFLHLVIQFKKDIQANTLERGKQIATFRNRNIKAYHTGEFSKWILPSANNQLKYKIQEKLGKFEYRHGCARRIGELGRNIYTLLTDVQQQYKSNHT